MLYILAAMFRLSLRKKLVYTFLGGSLLTVLLFSIVIKGIMNDYFQRLAEVRLQFVSDQGQREIRTNVAIFKDAFKSTFDNITTTVGALAQSGAIGDHLPLTQPERGRMADMLEHVEREAKLSMITVLDLEGRVIVRGNNAEAFGDDTLMREYENAPKPVSSIRRLILNALAGQTIQSFETFAPEILAKSNLAEQARIQLKTWIRPAPANMFEERGLVMTVVMPLRTSSGKLVGAVVAGRLLNKDQSIVSDVQKLLACSVL
jgi:two-component system NtrC family sensor kinase